MTAVFTLPPWRSMSSCRIPPNLLNLTKFTRTTFTSTPNILNMIARKALPRYDRNQKETRLFKAQIKIISFIHFPEISIDLYNHYKESKSFYSILICRQCNNCLTTTVLSKLHSSCIKYSSQCALCILWISWNILWPLFFYKGPEYRNLCRVSKLWWRAGQTP